MVWYVRPLCLKQVCVENISVNLFRKFALFNRELAHTRVRTLVWLSFLHLATPIISGPCRNCCVLCDYYEPFHKSGTSFSSLHSWLPDGYATGNPFGSRMEMVIERLTSKSGNRLHLLHPHRSLRMMTQRMKFHHDHTLSEDEEILACSTGSDPQGEGDRLCVPFGTQKLTDDGRSTPYGSPPPPPGLSIFSAIVLAAHKFKYRAEALGLPSPCARTASRSDAETSHPITPSVVPQRLLLHRSDIEILTLFDDDTSSIRDDYTTWVTADPTTVRARHMTDKGTVSRSLHKNTSGTDAHQYLGLGTWNQDAVHQAP